MQLKNRRKLLGISQKELAKEIGVTNDYISILERKNKIPSVDLIKKISTFFMKIAKEKELPIEIFTINSIFFEK